MEYTLLEVVRYIGQFIIFPLAAAIAYFFRKNFHRIDKLEDRVSSQEIRTSVIESKVDDIKEDIKEIKCGVAKLVDRI